jgi:phage recombination protein Bet
MSAVAEIVQLPAPVARRGITEAQWRTLMNNLYPGAAAESVVMVWDYCAARKLDPLKKPCHIVPMQVKDAKSGDYVWRDVVMPGIYEYRTTATRTGLYMGHSKPEYGPVIEHLGVSVPEWCAMTVYRWNKEAGQRVEYPVQVYFRECAGTRKDKSQGGKLVLNQRWQTAPIQMMTKVCEAAGLREAFPDELGGESTFEEMEGRVIEHEPQSSRIDPRGDLSGVDFEQRDKHVKEIQDILDADKEEHEIAQMLRDYELDALAGKQEMAIAVFDELAKRKIISKAKYREYLKIGLPEQERH